MTLKIKSQYLTILRHKSHPLSLAYVLFCLYESFLFRIRLLVICTEVKGEEEAWPMPDPRGVVAVTVETCAVIINRSGHSTVLQTNEGLKHYTMSTVECSIVG